MSRDDWYRNKTWDADIEAAFRAKLARSRSSRPQYICIQANYLVNDYPSTALDLIEEYFATDDTLQMPQALSTKAAAYRSLGKIEEAILTYKLALDWEQAHPHLITTARIDLPKLVIDQRLRGEYEYAVEILASRFRPMDHQFPSTRYLWNGCNALIANELGNHAEAHEFAERALQAAAETESPFRYHRSVGLVRNSSDDFGLRLKRIARPSKLRSLFRLVIGSKG